MIAASLGNKDLLKLRKTAFLCSRKISAAVALRCYDWAVEQREKGNCIISGFHSGIEKDVFHFLLAGTQPIIMVQARGMKQRFKPEIHSAINAGRLLVITPFKNEIKRVTAATAEQRNRFMIDIADEVVIGYAFASGMLDRVIMEFKEKKVSRIQI